AGTDTPPGERQPPVIGEGSRGGAPVNIRGSGPVAEPRAGGQPPPVAPRPIYQVQRHRPRPVGSPEASVPNAVPPPPLHQPNPLPGLSEPTVQATGPIPAPADTAAEAGMSPVALPPSPEPTSFRQAAQPVVAQRSAIWRQGI